MAPSKTTPPELDPDDLVQFVDSHRPNLTAGDYRVTVSQSLEVDEKAGDATRRAKKTFESKPLDFSVLGERFALGAEMIHAVYPPAGASGKFDHVLPHVIFERSTLPWERRPLAGGEDDPRSPSWLALLLFSESEIGPDKDPAVPTRTLSAKDLAAELGQKLEVGQHTSDQVVVVDVPWDLLRTVLPGYEDLRASAHVRRVRDGSEPPPAQDEGDEESGAGDPAAAKGPEVAVIMGNRLPRPMKAEASPTTRWVAHLVSLEGRYRIPATADSRLPRLAPSSPLVESAEEVKIVAAAQEALPERRCRLRLLAGRQPEFQIGSEGWRSLAGPVRDRAGLADLCSELLDQAAPPGDSEGPATQFERTGKVELTATIELDGEPRRARLRVFKTKGQEREPLDGAWVAEQLCPRLPPVFDEVLGNDEDRLGEVVFHGAGQVALDLGDAERHLARWVAARTRIALLAERAAVELWTKAASEAPTDEPLPVLLASRAGLKEGLEPEESRRREELERKAAHLEELEAELGRPQEQAAKTALEEELGTAKIEHRRLASLHRKLQRLIDRLGASFEETAQIQGLPEPIHLTIGEEAGGGGALTAALELAPRQTAAVFELLGPEPVFDPGGKTGEEKVALVSLRSWQFFREQEKGGFLEEMLALNRRLPPPVVPARQAASGSSPAAQDDTVRRAGGARFHVPLPKAIAETQDPTLAEGARYLRSGYVALPHRMRGGDRTVSWYRGPLVADSGSCATLGLPARGPDELLIYNESLGLFDASYAAAWELGRLVALEDASFAVKLFNWKRSHSRTLAHLRQKVDHGYLPLVRDLPGTGLPADLAAWFRSLTLLEGLPFNYLVPDERLLPANSIRFFSVDPTWLECLRDGVFSVGRVLARDRMDDQVKAEELERPPMLSGFLLRSAVVSDWPRLLADGYTAVHEGDAELDREPHPDYPKLTLERMDRLGPEVLICLFSDRAGREIEMADLHLPPEVLHFGLEEAGESLVKKLRSPRDGEDLERWVWAGGSEPERAAYRVDDRTIENLRLAGAGPEVVAAVEKLAGHAFELASRNLATPLGDPATLGAITAADATAFVADCLARKTLDVTIGDGETGTRRKTLRDFLIHYSGPWDLTLEKVRSIPWRHEPRRVVDLAALWQRVANQMVPVTGKGRFSAADFGLQMLDSPPLVRFLRPAAGEPGA